MSSKTVLGALDELRSPDSPASEFGANLKKLRSALEAYEHSDGSHKEEMRRLKAVLEVRFGDVLVLRDLLDTQIALAQDMLTLP